MADSAEGTERLRASDADDADGLQSAANMTGQVSTVDRDVESRLVPARNGGQIWNKWPKSAREAPRQSPVAALRDAMRKGLDDLLPGLIDDIASGKVSKLQGADFLARYGIGATGTVTIVSPDVIARLEKQANAIAARPNWDTVELLSVLRDIWT